MRFDVVQPSAYIASAEYPSVTPIDWFVHYWFPLNPSKLTKNSMVTGMRKYCCRYANPASSPSSFTTADTLAKILPFIIRFTPARNRLFLAVTFEDQFAFPMSNQMNRISRKFSSSASITPSSNTTVNGLRVLRSPFVNETV